MTLTSNPPYAISLTSIPPRFGGLEPVLNALLDQQPAPAEILLCLPEIYDRFPKQHDLPALPDGVTVLRGGRDLGPGMKALNGAAYVLGRVSRLIYCDDDWLMGPGWAAHLLMAQQGGEAVTGRGFGVGRLRRQSVCATGYCDIAQGFAGVLVDPEWLIDATPPLDLAARMVDDIWLSAHLAAKGIAIREAPLARQAISPCAKDRHGLQDEIVDGHNRADANRRCAAQMAARYGIWPEVGSRTARAARV